MATGGIEMLFACTYCHKRYKMEELSAIQQLCKTCRKKFPSIPCTYCRLDFHPIDTTKGSSPACESCAKDFKQYGKPSNCSICGQRSAFKGNKCTRCSHSEKKYGTPVSCDQCAKRCAFRKNDDTKKKVDGKTLCLLCTLSYKKAQFKQKNKPGKRQLHDHHSHHSGDPPKSKKKRSEVSPLPMFSYSSSSAFSSVPLAGAKDTRDPLSSELMQETERLREQVSNLKKQVSSKDQALLEKDKTICSLRAENLEKDKDYRQKLQTMQRNHNEQVENLKIDIQGLKKQLSQQSKTKTKQPHTPSNASSSLLKS